MQKEVIAILGAGSWGTAIAIQLARSGHSVMLWSHQSQHVKEMQEQAVNGRYLPAIPFPETLLPCDDLQHCMSTAHDIIVAVPSHAFATVLAQIKQKPSALSWLTKGLDPTTHQLLSQLVKDRYGEAFPLAIIAGPSFAREVAEGLPTALVIASCHTAYQQHLSTLLHHAPLRIYLSADLIGVQLCGIVKNVLAIACGISDGLGYGANAKALLITRGLAEMSALGLSMGASRETFTGLAGMGDLVLTCTDNQSRNRQFGLQLGKGISISEASKTVNQVIEGQSNAAQVCALALEKNIEMPICEAVNAILQGVQTAQEAADSLMQRSARTS